MTRGEEQNRLTWLAIGIGAMASAATSHFTENVLLGIGTGMTTMLLAALVIDVAQRRRRRAKGTNETPAATEPPSKGEPQKGRTH